MKGWDRLEHLARELHGRMHVTVLLGHSAAYSPVHLTGDCDIKILQDLDDADLPSLYRAADWLLSTSRWEGFGLAIAEALACGTPVLLPRDLGTAPELLAGGGGHLYRCADDLAALLARPARPDVRLPSRFDWDRNATTTLAAYRSVAAATVSR